MTSGSRTAGEGPQSLTRLALERVRAGDLASSRPGPVAAIVAWARQGGSPSEALDCAELLHHEGGRARDAGDIDVALALLDLAERLHRGLGDDDGALRVLVSRGELYGLLRCGGATVASVEEAWDARVTALPADGEVDPATWMQLVDLAGWLVGQLVRERDLRGLVVARRRIGALLARAPREDGADAAVRRLLERATETLRGTRLRCAVMEADGRAWAALGRGDDAGAERAFAEALAVADTGTDPAPALHVLASRRDGAELARRLHGLGAAGVCLPVEEEAALWWDAGHPGRAEATLAAAGRTAPPPRVPTWHQQWGSCLLRARIALAGDALADADHLAREGIARFDDWFAAVTTDAFRISALDDPDVRRLHDVLAEIAHRRGDDRGVLPAADRVRSLSLGALVAESLADGPAPATVRRRREALATWNGMFDRRRAAWRSGDALARDRSAVELDVAQRELDLAVAVAPATPSRPLPGADVDEVAAALDPDMLLVHYTVTDDALLVTTLARDGTDVVRVDVSRRALLGGAARLHRAWEKGRSGAQDLAAVTEALLAPIRGRLTDSPRLVVVPDAGLHTLPFAALPLAGEPLVAHHAVSQLPAAALVPRLAGTPRVRPGRGSVVVGDPVEGAGELPGARVEALAVARMLDTSALVGERADEPRVRAGMAAARGVVHLATHGRLDEQAPDLSGLAVAGGDEITVAELLGMGLDADLAVLSACDSGRGEITQGGDVVGLTRSLIAAGVRHTVVSLWPVDDRVACLVMVGFVERVVAGEPVAQALAAAQREVRLQSGAERLARFDELAAATGTGSMIRGASRRRARTRDGRVLDPATLDGRHPSWWAPFVHVGV